MRCQPCIVESHQENPFHQVEKWNGVFFERTSLGDLGLELFCGHDGLRCPSTSTDSMTMMTIVASGGSHTLPVYSCCCSIGANHSFAEQLFLMGLFPATDTSPESAATFQALDDFDIHNLCGKESIWDYFEVVRRKTNSVQPHLVPVCQSEAAHV